jgi:ABC-type lipoprotein release transport system permease subunit
VTAVWYRFRAELRSRWRAWLGLGLLVGLAAGAVMALAAGARRTDTAYARFLDAHNAYDVMVVDFAQPGFPGVGGFDEIRALPSVEDSAEGEVGLLPLGPTGVTGIASEDGRIGTEINTFKILEGRRADPERVDEVVVSFTVAEELGLDVGSTIPFLPPDDIENAVGPDKVAAAWRFLEQAPDGRLRVVGIEASPGEFPPQVHGGKPLVHLTPALYRLHLLRLDDPPITPRALLVNLRDGADGVSAFNAELNRLSDGPALDSLAQADHAAAVERSVDLQAVALWLLAGLVAASTTLIVGQLLSRLTLVEAQDHPTLGALGMSGRDRALLGVIRAGAIATVGALAGLGVAVAASPLLPTGMARTAEPDPGVRLDGLVLGLGVAATVVVVVALGLWAAWRAAAAARQLRAGAEQARLRPSGVARVLAEGGWPLPAKVGVRMALEPGRGSTAVPVRTTLAGVTLGVGALVAALTFGASLAHLLDSPRLYGLTWDLQLYDYTDETFADRGVPLLRDDPRVEAVGVGSSGAALVEVEGRRVDSIALDSVDGDITLPILAGRPPQGPDEVVLGSRTARALGAEIGDTVEVGASIAGAPPVPMRVVGRAVFPSVSDSFRMGEGVLASVAAADALTPDDPSSFGDLFVRLAPGADADAVVADFNARAGAKAIVEALGEPSDIVNFGRVESMPFVLGGILATIAAATLAHLLVSAVRRRRRDLAILKTLGFVRGQVAGAVAWQATTVMVVSLVVAVPLGAALGRWVWTLLADDLGVIARPRVPLLALVATAGAGVLLANAIALVPGQIAARTHPATDLRSE